MSPLIAPPALPPPSSVSPAIASSSVASEPQAVAQTAGAIAAPEVSFTPTESPQFSEGVANAPLTDTTTLTPVNTPLGEAQSIAPSDDTSAASSPVEAQDSALRATTTAETKPGMTAQAIPEVSSPAAQFSPRPASEADSTAPVDLQQPGQTIGVNEGLSTIAQDSAVGTTACAPTEENCALEESAPVTDAEATVRVNTVNVQGSSVFDQATLEATLKPFIGRTLTLTEQRAAADAITQLYLDQGYITSTAIPGDPAVQNGALQIQVIEGGLERIDIIGLENLREDYVRSRIELVTGRPLNSARLEEQLRLLRQNPLFENIEASLKAGTSQGNSILTVRVDEADPLDGYVGIDNHSSAVVGSEEFSLAMAHQNLTGRGDRLGANFQRTFSGGATTFGLGYSIPVNPMEGTLQVQASFERSRIPVTANLNIDGEAEEYSVRFRQPLIRTLDEEFALSLRFDYRDGQTFLGNIPFGFGPGPDPDTGISRTSVVRFGQEYVKRDVQGAWAVRSQFNLGLPIFGATVNPAPTPDSQFFSWLGQAQRVQRLNDSHLLILQADLQLSPSSLLPSEQFALGGWSSVRGYRQNIRAGDNGLRFSVEDRITLQRNEAGLPTLQIAPFAEMGTVWNASGNPVVAQPFLAGLGVGTIWEPIPDLNLRFDLALPLIDTANQGNALQRQGIYFQVGYRI